MFSTKQGAANPLRSVLINTVYESASPSFRSNIWLDISHTSCRFIQLAKSDLTSNTACDC